MKKWLAPMASLFAGCSGPSESADGEVAANEEEFGAARSTPATPQYGSVRSPSAIAREVR